MNKLIIRKAQLEDLEKIYYYGSGAEEFFVGEETGGFWSKRQLRNWILSENDICLVAIYNKNLIGFLLSSFHKPTNKLTIENLYVVEKRRKQGVAKKILQYLMSKAFSLGSVYIMSLARKQNKPFIRLMKKAGFVCGYEDWVWIEKELTDEFPKRKK